MRAIPQAIIDALESKNFKPIFFVEVLFQTPLRFTSFYASKTVGGVEYFGLGNLGSVSSVSENADLDPQQLSISIAGVSQASLAGALTEPYLNRDAKVMVGMLDENDELLSDPFNYFVGKVDEMPCKYGKEGRIEIIVRDRLADWGRPRIERYTNAAQQAKYPGDKGLEFVSQVAEKEIIWPASSYF
ncbi:hypothetical protein [Marinobacter alexandrii]|uniref:hypothetical protein n=1 Tax=Marinobacter alexandrii TaxID=2570351 RepID=UPI001109F4E9|nr:hypothetical protein [Marinobacter alexandrii]